MSSAHPREHRCAVAIAACLLIAIATGACLTSESLPLPGSDAPAKLMAGVGALRETHRYIAEGTAGLAALFSVWLLLRGTTMWQRAAAALTLVIVLVECWLGSGATPGMAHAVLAPVLFSCVVAIAILTAADSSPATPADPRQAGLVRAIPLVILFQIVLGAAFRHNFANVLWHILDAMVVISLVLTVSVLLLRPPAVSRGMRTATLTLAIVAGVQVLLGFAVYIALLMSAENSVAIVALSTAHVVTGTLTLAAGVALALQVRP